MKFFVSTSSTLSIYEDGLVTDVRTQPDSRRIYGLTWSSDELFLAVNHPKEKQDFVERFVKGDKGILKMKGRVNLPKMTGVHQMLVVGKQLFIVNTDANAIVTYRLDAGKSSSHKWRDNSTVVHMNSIWFDRSDKLFYIVEHRNEDSRIVVTDQKFKIKHEIKNAGKHMHNVYVEGDLIFSCSSNENSFVSINKKTRKVVKKHKFGMPKGIEPWYTRGIARLKDGWLVGFSRRAKRDVRTHTGSGIVMVLDNNWKTVDVIEIPSRGQINEIRLVGESDLTHNGIVW